MYTYVQVDTDVKMYTDVVVYKNVLLYTDIHQYIVVQISVNYHEVYRLATIFMKVGG